MLETHSSSGCTLGKGSLPIGGGYSILPKGTGGKTKTEDNQENLESWDPLIKGKI